MDLIIYFHYPLFFDIEWTFKMIGFPLDVNRKSYQLIDTNDQLIAKAL
jgi:hypothetical protein